MVSNEAKLYLKFWHFKSIDYFNTVKPSFVYVLISILTLNPYTKCQLSVMLYFIVKS